MISDSLAEHWYWTLHTGCFCLSGIDTALVMESNNLKNFRILEDNAPLFEGDANGLKCHTSKVPERKKRWNHRSNSS